MRLCSRLTGKRKPRPGLGVAAFSPKQPAARRRRWRRAHFGTTGLKTLPPHRTCPFAMMAIISYESRKLFNKIFINYLLIGVFKNNCIYCNNCNKIFSIYIKNFYLYIKTAFAPLLSAPTTKRSNRTTNKTPPPPNAKTASPFRKRTAKLRTDRLLGRWTQNAPTSSACGARRAVLGRKALPLTPAAVCASPPVAYQPAIAPILTKTPLHRTAA